MLAYSSIAHAGYLLAAFTAFPQAGISAACFYTAAYAAMNVGAFAVVTQVGGYPRRCAASRDYQGLALRRPVLAALFAFFLLSLIGIPFTGGFFGKFYVFAAVLSGRPRLARRHRPDQQRRCLLLLPQAARLDLHKARSDGVSNNSRLCSGGSVCPRASDLPSPPRPRCCSASCPATSSTWPTPPARACAANLRNRNAFRVLRRQPPPPQPPSGRAPVALFDRYKRAQIHYNSSGGCNPHPVVIRINQ